MVDKSKIQTSTFAEAMVDKSKNQRSTFAEAMVDKSKTNPAVVVSLTNNFLLNGKSHISPYLTSDICDLTFTPSLVFIGDPSYTDLRRSADSSVVHRLCSMNER
jgi:hypothetical protein